MENDSKGKNVQDDNYCGTHLPARGGAPTCSS